MKRYEYKIYEEVYNDIKSGKKTIEFRLLNEKSKSINIGDEILFEVKDNEGKNILIEVVNKYFFDSIEDLWNHKNLLSNMLNYNKESFTNEFYKIFGKENAINSKIIGIEFKVK